MATQALTVPGGTTGILIPNSGTIVFLHATVTAGGTDLSFGFDPNWANNIVGAPAGAATDLFVAIPLKVPVKSGQRVFSRITSIIYVE